MANPETNIGKQTSGSAVQTHIPENRAGSFIVKENDLAKVAICHYTFEQLEANPRLKEDIIETYRDVFGGEPWNEWKRCLGCANHFSKREYEDMESRGIVQHCQDDRLVDYHAPEEVEGRMRSELTKKNSTPFLIIAERQIPDEGGNKVAGFTWGYGQELDLMLADIISNYFPSINQERADGIVRKVLGRMKDIGLNTNVSYVSEIGVVEKMRGIREDGSIATGLMREIAEKQIPLGSRTVLLWTARNAVIYEMMQIFGAQEIYSFSEDEESDNRVFMAGNGLEIAQTIRECDTGSKLKTLYLKRMRVMRKGVPQKDND
jgi:hypothetical protein